MKLEYYKEVLNFSNIEYHIIFLITQISGQQCYTDYSLKTRVQYYLKLDFVKLKY